jgi:hypothetical protein
VESGIVTFEHPLLLLLLVFPAAFAAWYWRSTQQRVALILKSLMLAAVVLALAEPRVDVWETKVATVVLVDTSAGVSSADLARASEIANKIDKAKGRHWVRVVPFARGGRPVGDGEHRHRVCCARRHCVSAGGHGAAPGRSVRRK